MPPQFRPSAERFGSYSGLAFEMSSSRPTAVGARGGARCVWELINNGRPENFSNRSCCRFSSLVFFLRKPFFKINFQLREKSKSSFLCTKVCSISLLPMFSSCGFDELVIKT
ncbi:uncharacterized protein [Bemisia tabaci]|uniref:uncharacterized protein n=1 Tax=Bemisia tabaci TaxID=7038 RepID=UPI003B27E5FF